MSTARDILNEALPRSNQNRVGAIANEGNELRLVVARSLRALMAYGARVNPGYFGKTAAVLGVDGDYARPADAEAVWLIEDADQEEVVVVPMDDRTTSYGRARLTRLGRNYRTVGGTGDPGATDTLTFYYAHRADTPATLDTALDTLWPADYDPLLVEEVALYLAVKDGRAAEIASIRPDRDAWLKLFHAHLEHETMNEVRRFHPSRFTDMAQVPLAGEEG